MDEIGLTVADLFCGAGGFSEGFKQMGFEIIYGMDHWKPAIKTFNKNFPDAKVPGPTDILNIDIEDVPDADIIIGGPPCTYFSSSNKGGNGDVDKGMKLVKKFFEIIKKKEPEFWIMENVTRLNRSLSKARDEGGLEIDIPEINKYLAADFGVPQRRRRLFSGVYPDIDKFSTKDRWITREEVIGTLPHPTDINPDRLYSDPLYENIKLKGRFLTEHDYKTHLTEYEWWEVRRRKKRHRYYGNMDFPDIILDENFERTKPSRTVMASVSKSSRETMVIKDSRGEEVNYRVPTIRENASLQSFPITFQFWAPTASQRYRLVGNAVPPILARQFAKAILEEKGEDIPEKHIVSEISEVPEKKNRDSLYRGDRKYPLSRKFVDFIGDKSNSSRRGCRIDIDNYVEEKPIHPLYHDFDEDIKHITGYRCVLYTGYAKNVMDMGIELKDLSLFYKKQDKHFRNKIKSIYDWIKDFDINHLPDASTYQAFWTARKRNLYPTPYWIRRRLNDIIDLFFPKEKETSHELIEKNNGLNLRDEINMTKRDAGKVILGTIACKIINDSDVWILKNWDDHYRKKDWPKIKKPEESNKDTILRDIEKNLFG